MKALRDLDARIAKRVMGREVVAGVGGFDGHSGWRDDYGFSDSRGPRNLPYAFGDDLPEDNANYKRVPFYSTSTADAWLVIEKLFELGFNPTVQFNQINQPPERQWFVSFMNVPGTAHAPTAAEAICLAALEVVDAP